MCKAIHLLWSLKMIWIKLYFCTSNKKMYLVNMFTYFAFQQIFISYNRAFFKEMLWVWKSQPTMGECKLWNLDLFGMFREAQRSWSSSFVRQVRHDGQVEGHRTGEDEGGRQQESKTIPQWSARLEWLSKHNKQV